ncbi:M15 family metallopeptidase [Paenibacillus sp. EC2-1]|uniref:M15 family metallopeptidase n=1 Tax=Paenibacillus sp. EC2-1 TaxID=3388665 RepID=UPI003BEEF224
MKKWLCLLLLVMLVGCESVQSQQGMGNSEQENKVPVVQPEKTHDTIQISKDQVHKGNLVLVNKKYPIHKEGLPTDIVNLYQNNELIQGYSLLDNTIQISTLVAEQFNKMVAAAARSEVNHFMISSGYRDNTEQKKLYQEMGSDYALPPGYSEHNVGLSLDIGSTLKSIDVAPEGSWLKKYAWNYGFILRYPLDKSEITGIQYEPWHFRYVGLPHSIIMKEQHLTLEEYLKFLKEQKTYTTTINGKQYEISFVPLSEQMTFEIPVNSMYELSGNNTDGVIVTIEKN